jgi:hypothetical protein
MIAESGEMVVRLLFRAPRGITRLVKIARGQGMCAAAGNGGRGNALYRSEAGRAIPSPLSNRLGTSITSKSGEVVFGVR